MNLLKTVLLGAVALAAAAPAYAAGSLFFVISGDTFNAPFSITNQSTMGETVTGFGLTLVTPYGFDTVNGGFGIDSANAFSPSGGTGVTTGYTGPGSFADGAGSIAFTFNDFGVGETFSWLIDVDQGQIAATVFGNELIGAAAYADFSNGLRGSGFLVAVAGDPSASQFVITTIAPTPGIPEPASWAMMIAGFGLVGAAQRRRATAVVAA